MAKDSILEALVKSGIRAATPVFSRAVAKQAVRASPKLNPDHPMAPPLTGGPARQELPRASGGRPEPRLVGASSTATPPAPTVASAAPAPQAAAQQVIAAALAETSPTSLVEFCSPAEGALYAARVENGKVAEMRPAATLPVGEWHTFRLVPFPGASR